MTAFTSSTIALSSRGSMVVVPRRRSINDVPLGDERLLVSFQTNHQTTPVTYSTGLNTYTPSNAFFLPINTPITFTAAVVQAQRVSPIEYYWRFGDGAEAFGQTVTHTYVTDSPYSQAVLRVTDSRGRQYFVRRQLYLTSPFGPLLPSTTLLPSPTLLPR